MALKQTTNSQGDLILSLGTEKYTFRQPTGRDLVALEKVVKNGEQTDAETLAAIMAQHSRDKLDADIFLDMPLATFKTIGAKMLESFRAEDS
jgi:hypothetical protein